MRFLHQWNRRVDVVASKVASFETESFVGPDAFDHLQRFESHLSLLLPGNVVGGEGKRADAGAKATFQTTFGEIVEQSNFLGNADWIPQRQHIHQRSQAYPLGARSEERRVGK